MFARTDRLLLRPGFADDASELTQCIADETIARNLARLPWPYAIEDAQAYLALDAQPNEFKALIFMRTADAPRLVGGIGLHPVADDCADWGSLPAIELGYWIARPYWGLGIATEAGRALIAMARSIGAPRIVSGHFVDNPASGAVLRKLGLRSTGRVVPRFSSGRGHDVACALFEHDPEPAVEGDPERPTMADLIYRDSGVESRLAA